MKGGKRFLGTVTKSGKVPWLWWFLGNYTQRSPSSAYGEDGNQIVYLTDTQSAYCDEKDYKHIICACHHPSLPTETVRKKYVKLISLHRSQICSLGKLLSFWSCYLFVKGFFFSLVQICPPTLKQKLKLILRLHRSSSHKHCGICRCVYIAWSWCKSSLKVIQDVYTAVFDECLLEYWGMCRGPELLNQKALERVSRVLLPWYRHYASASALYTAVFLCVHCSC